jgi:putative tricarboxylic transport membrane protein
MQDAFFPALQALFHIDFLLACGLGSLIGFIIGAIPGIGPAVGIALVIPFSLTFSPGVALTLFMGIYSGAEFGGCVSAILINVPGTGGAAATVMDGFPMAKQGRAITAISISSVASGVGGIIAPIILILLLPFLSRFILLFGTPEFFLLGILGVACIAAVSKETMIKGLISGFFGLMLTTVGISPVDAQQRYTFGSIYLFDGFDFLPAIIGLFGVAEMLKLIKGKEQGIAETIRLTGSRLEGALLTFKHWRTLIKSSLIGLFIGLVPGVGGTTATFVAWAEAKRNSKEPETFGHGNPEGVVATESSNNSVVSGALMPTLLFGIPGSGTAAIILGGLMMHGLNPGRELFRSQGLVMTETILLSLIVSSIFMVIICLIVAPHLGKVTLIRKEILIPAVYNLAALGIFIIGYNMFDVILILLFGLFGFCLTKIQYPLFPLILAIILGNMIEENFHRSLILGKGSLLYLIQKPASVVILIITVLILINPLISFIWGKLKWRKLKKDR